LNDKWKCKSCDKTYNKLISGKILKNHFINNHSRGKGRKITDFLVKKIDKNFRKDLNSFIINGCHAFNIVEESDFKRMITNLSPDTQIPSRFTVKKDIQTEFEEKKTQLKYELSLIYNKIALTTDIWTSMSNRPYASITAHFVNSNKVLSHVLLDFCYIPYPHSGEQIKNLIIDVLKDYGIEDRIIAITTDNATNNIKGIELLNEYFEKEFNSNICHFPCFGHVLNLSINNGIKQISKILNNLRIIASKLKNSPKQQ